MTENKIGRKLYWFWAVYASFIPFALLYLPFIIIIKKLSLNIQTNLQLIIFILFWLGSFLLSVILIRKPYLKMYQKYNWDYDGDYLFNPNKNIFIKMDEIVKIYIGFSDKKRRLTYGFIKLFKPTIHQFIEIGSKNVLTLELNKKRILFLQFLGLENGMELQKQFIDNSKQKLSGEPFNVLNYRLEGNKLKWYRILQQKTT